VSWPRTPRDLMSVQSKNNGLMPMMHCKEHVYCDDHDSDGSSLISYGAETAQSSCIQNTGHTMKYLTAPSSQCGLKICTMVADTAELQAKRR